MASISKIKIGTEIRDIHAVQLTNERKITLSGSVTGTGYFDGSGDLTITTSTNHTHNYAGSSSAGGGAKKNESYQVGSITTTYGNQWNIINQWITNDRLKIQVLNDGAVQSSYPIEVNHAYKLVDPSADYNKTTALLSKGSATQPVYFSEGVPVACTYSVNATVPANAKFTDTVYTHPTTSGNKHIPAGGSSGQILRWSADGTAVWGNDNNTTYSVATESANGLLSKEDKIKLNNTNVAYGTCATAADVAEKTVALSGNTQWALKNGSIIMVKFNITNTASNVTLNVNNTGAYPIWYSNAEYTSTGSAYTGYANRTITYMFNGTHWVWISGSYDANTQSNTNSTNTNSKIFIIGATSQGSNKTTYSHDTAYVGTDGCLYSNSTKVSVEGHTHNYAGSSSAGGAANSVKTNLIIKLNGGSTEGTNLFTFNGSTAKTINITPSAIGAAAASHGTHVSYGTTASAVNTTASAGTATTVSRSDHVHSLDKATVVAALGYTPPTIDTTYGSMSSSEGITGTATTNRVLTAANLKAIIGGSTAGAVAWDNITGKPTSFAPSTHDHDSTYVNVTGDTMTGNLFIKSGNPYLGFKNASGETTGYVQYVESTDSYGIGAGIAKSLVVTNSGSISIPANQTFTPRTTNTGSIGTSNVKWNAMYATTFYGALSGNASSASKVNNSLTIKLNGGTTEGTNLFTFNGSAAKSINITPAAIGAAAASHGTHVTYSTTAPVMDGAASVGSAATVARSDHKHPTDTSRAAASDLTSHTGNTTIHITATERTNWNAAKTHADSAHAPSNAEKNQNAFSNIVVGSTTISADTVTDSLTLVGSNVTLTPDATNDKVTIGITKENVTTALGYTPPTTNTTYGSMSSSEGITGTATIDRVLTAANLKAIINGSAAAKLATARTIRTNLASTASASFDGTTDITPGITGVLGIPNGGTGANNRKTAITNLGVFGLYSREDIGIAPNFDNPGVNGLFEMRAKTETTGETGTKPFDGFAPFISLRYSNTMFQLAGNNNFGFYVRGKQGTDPTLTDTAWQKFLTSANWSDYAAPAQHTHSYLPLSGGHMSGRIGTIYGTPASSIGNMYTTAAIQIRENNAVGNAQSDILYAPTLGFHWSGRVACNLSLHSDGALYLYNNGGNLSTFKAGSVYGAVWNDYAEFRICNEDFKPGQVVIENGDDTLSIAIQRLQRGCSIISDTFGFAIGETDEAKCPIAVSGRVLAYGYESREEFKKHIGWPVCSGPNGTVSIMTEEEEEKYPSRIIGTISAVPDYETWGTGNVEVNNRIWIKIK